MFLSLFSIVFEAVIPGSIGVCGGGRKQAFLGGAGGTLYMLVGQFKTLNDSTGQS